MNATALTGHIEIEVGGDCTNRFVSVPHAWVEAPTFTQKAEPPPPERL